MHLGCHILECQNQAWALHMNAHAATVQNRHLNTMRIVTHHATIPLVDGLGQRVNGLHIQIVGGLILRDRPQHQRTVPIKRLALQAHSPLHAKNAGQVRERGMSVSATEASSGWPARLAMPRKLAALPPGNDSMSHAQMGAYQGQDVGCLVGEPGEDEAAAQAIA